MKQRTIRARFNVITRVRSVPSDRCECYFSGKINLRKGVGAITRGGEAVVRRTRRILVCWANADPRAAGVETAPQVSWFGVAPRVSVESYYRDADVFIFPTLSDGFGLTQLEAQAWKLPVIASRYCGEVVRDGVNGVVLEEVCGEAIAEVIARVV